MNKYATLGTVLIIGAVSLQLQQQHSNEVVYDAAKYDCVQDQAIEPTTLKEVRDIMEVCDVSLVQYVDYTIGDE